MKNKIIVSTIIIVALATTMFILLFLNSKKKEEKPEYKGYRYQDLVNTGYTENEIDWILKTLDNTSINTVLNYQHQSKLKDIVENKSYKNENLNNYLEMLTKFTIDIDDIIYIVNDESYNSNIDYNEFVINMIMEEYYLKDRLNRYIDYHNKNDKKSVKEVIQDVNSNIDYEFYTNTESTDTSKGNLMLVNKYYKLDKNYVPANLVTIESSYGLSRKMVKEAYEAFKKMVDAAKSEGYNFYAASPYRDYNYQQTLYNNYVKSDGKKNADTYSARPGYSEHQTGLAVDVMARSNSSLNQFEKTKEFKWMSNNAYKYGFILRYPKGKEYITGYIYEAWHYRYVGVEAAKVIYEKDLTLEEYYAYYVK